MIFEYKGKVYPECIRNGNANKFIEPFAKEFCKGKGLDIGGFGDWIFPDAKAINITIDDEYDAYNLPDEKYDFIFSSHCLEHLNNYIEALEYWKTKLKKDGVLFLYLPHPDMEYWLPQNNRKHLHSFSPIEIAGAMVDLGFEDLIWSERDLYWSFAVIGFNNEQHTR